MGVTLTGAVRRYCPSHPRPGRGLGTPGSQRAFSWSPSLVAAGPEVGGVAVGMGRGCEIRFCGVIIILRASVGRLVSRPGRLHAYASPRTLHSLWEMSSLGPAAPFSRRGNEEPKEPRDTSKVIQMRGPGLTPGPSETSWTALCSVLSCRPSEKSCFEKARSVGSEAELPGFKSQFHFCDHGRVNQPHLCLPPGNWG